MDVFSPSLLAGRTALVTAAAQGIGRASAIALADAGAAVFATDINEAALVSLAEQHPSITALPLDVRDPSSIQAAHARTGPVDVLFNCAGTVHQGSLLECDDEAWAFSMDLNVTAMFRMIRTYLPGMLEQGRGSIINMSSVAGAVKGVASRAAYCATKAAVAGLTRSIAADYVTKGVRCNAICPGTVETPSLHDRMRAQGDYEKARAAFIARQPMGRLGTPEEIAALVVYLASDASAYTTGQLHVIDGGWTA
ncbi:SDR family oxidoreductase [Microvirga arsenatis]|uniref:SDR family oxidoreductase n=1 Tax=Microvirga arsenatis TaxID=2692265 RepID=A0ABW9YW41_9HYPH|nr:SDR family oxidoreductase [Microvirga arsenatis]NBJ10023.1 SDR family oxidoreductase [Microvirga arsenatis]NBJ23091.1 SDR family oxidoreductase [Microvirga arsenatis]